MSELAIKAENISKLFRLGTIGTGSLKQDVTRWWRSNVLKRQDPFFLAANDDEQAGPIKDNYLWALKNVSFEINKGEVCGVIGRNGSGKTTLLKILSKISKPTEGVIYGSGKISSLLEVGTGFHHELTGRENIFISGYMLGMKKAEILKKFDEIVDFSGIESFLDTPVKRYSSGMYVRLAFAVAAHLEPDILIVDEVLAVGDAEFQKKCMGKMKSVSNQQGRTIIFVSHNMQAITSLCSKALWLQKGKCVVMGEASSIVNSYTHSLQKKLWKQHWDENDAPGNEHIKVLSVQLIPHLNNPLEPIDIRTPLTVRFKFLNNRDGISLTTGLQLFTVSGECVFDVTHEPDVFTRGVVEGECLIPGNFLNDGSYYISIIFVEDTSKALFFLEECLHFDVEDYRGDIKWFGKWPGYVRPQLPYKLTQLDAVEATV